MAEFLTANDPAKDRTVPGPITYEVRDTIDDSFDRAACELFLISFGYSVNHPTLGSWRILYLLPNPANPHISSRTYTSILLTYTLGKLFPFDLVSDHDFILANMAPDLTKFRRTLDYVSY